MRALPCLLHHGVRLDVVIMSGPTSFEEALVEFVFIDELLANDGVLALLELPAVVVGPLLEYVRRARCYEVSSEDTELMILLKRGRAAAPHVPSPLAWTALDEPAPHDDLPQGSPIAGSDSRDLYISSARVAHIAALNRELQRQLWRAEVAASREIDTLRTALAHRDEAAAEAAGQTAALRDLAAAAQASSAAAAGEIDTLKVLLAEARAAHRAAEHELAQVTGSRSWRLTSPLRRARQGTRRAAGR